MRDPFGYLKCLLFRICIIISFVLLLGLFDFILSFFVPFFGGHLTLFFLLPLFCQKLSFVYLFIYLFFLGYLLLLITVLSRKTILRWE